MDEGLQWYRRRPRAFLDGVQGMGPELIGAYAVLLDLFYARGGLSLRDDRHLGGILGCSTRKAKSLTDALLERGKIVVRGEFITNSVVEKEARSSRTTREAQAKHGRMGAEKRWRGKENNDLEMASPSTPHMAEKSRVEKKGTEPNGSAAEAPIDPEKVLFDSGVKLLCASGITEAKARANIGRWKKAHGSEAVLVALGITQRAGATEPVGYIERVLRNAAKGKPVETEDGRVVYADAFGGGPIHR